MSRDSSRHSSPYLQNCPMAVIPLALCGGALTSLFIGITLRKDNLILQDRVGFKRNARNYFLSRRKITPPGASQRSIYLKNSCVL